MDFSSGASMLTSGGSERVGEHEGEHSGRGIEGTGEGGGTHSY